MPRCGGSDPSLSMGSLHKLVQGCAAHFQPRLPLLSYLPALGLLRRGQPGGEVSPTLQGRPVVAAEVAGRGGFHRLSGRGPHPWDSCSNPSGLILWLRCGVQPRPGMQKGSGEGRGPRPPPALLWGDSCSPTRPRLSVPLLVGAARGATSGWLHSTTSCHLLPLPLLQMRRAWGPSSL